MKYIYSLVILILFNVSLFAGNSIHLKSGTISTTENAQDFISSNTLASFEDVNGKYYLCASFSEIPTQETKVALEATGINFLNYLPEKSYIVTVSSNVHLQEMKNAGAFYFSSLEKEFKMNKAFLNSDFPSHCLVSKDNIRISILLHDDIDFTWAKDIIVNSGYKVVNEYPSANRLTMDVNVQSIDELASTPFIQWIEAVEADPVPDDTEAKSLHRSNFISVNYPGGKKYDGTGVVAAIADDGAIGPHIDYKGRLNQNANVTGNSGNHGDMTAGILMGAGNIDPTIPGHATGAFMEYYDINNYQHIVDIPTTYTSKDIRVTSTSYSQGTGGVYDATSVDVDEQITDYEGLIHIFSAGNAGNSDHGYGAGAGWGNITGGRKAAKNVIACGNLNDSDILEGSSSRGPADDGRIKPELCANGFAQLSTDDPNGYQTGGGTSAAAPSVAGVFTQLVHAYREIYNVTETPSALIKASLLNTAEDLGRSGPDYEHGWGRINGRAALKVLEDTTWILDSVTQGSTINHFINVPANTQELRVMVYWPDYKGTAAAAKALVNDIDIDLTDPSVVNYLPWRLDPKPNTTSLSTTAWRGVDSLNNAEQVTIDNPAAGSYTLAVNGTSIPQGPQKYYVVYQIIGEELTLTYPTGGEHLAPGTTEIARWDAPSGTGNFSLEISTDGGTNWSAFSTNISTSDRQFSFTVPSTQTGQALMRISRNGISDQSDREFNIMNVPNNLDITEACPYTLKLEWDPVTGATSYDGFVIGQKYMDSVGTTTNTWIEIPIPSPTAEVWVSVRANGPNGAVGRRAYAVEKIGTIFNCTVNNDLSIDVVSPANGVITDCHSIGTLPVTVELTNTGLNNLSNPTVKYRVNGGAIQTETYTGTINSGLTATHTFATNVNYSSFNTYNVEAWLELAADSIPFNDTARNTTVTQSGTLVSGLVTEDFESFGNCGTSSDCGGTSCALGNGWINETNGVTDDIDYRVDNGGTFSGNTGPTIDHSPGTSQGNYAYTEVSGGCNNRVANLLSPCFDLTSTSQPEFSFWYHMFGAHIGELHVDVFDGTKYVEDVIPMISGPQGNVWLQQTIDLSPYNGSVVNVRVRAISGNDFQGDLALDDFSFVDKANAPAAAFNFTPSNPCPNENITFTDNSTGTGLSHSWSFGVGSVPSTASGPGPHTVYYVNSGNKSVDLTVSNSGGSDNSMQTVQVDVLPNAQFSYVPNGGAIVANNLSANANSFMWQFGDGTTSNQMNPYHAFPSNGNYQVMLIAINNCGNDTIIKSIDIAGVGINEVNFDGVFEVFPNPVETTLQINIEGTEQGDWNLRLTNMLGQALLEKSLDGSSNGIVEMDISALSSGSYVIELLNGRNLAAKKHVLKK